MLYTLGFPKHPYERSGFPGDTAGRGGGAELSTHESERKGEREQEKENERNRRKRERR